MGAIGDIAGAIIGAKASKKAAKVQERLGREAIDETRRQYDLTRSDLAPWQQAGGQAIGQGLAMLQPGYDHRTSPGYEFRFSEGQRAVEGGGAAKGMLMSGGTLKDLARFGDGLASMDFNDQFNRTMAVAGGGQQAATSLGQLGAQASQNIGNTLTGIGNARASGYMGQANAWINGINNVDARMQQAAQMMSERQLKTDIEPLGYEIGGVPAYSFNYRQDADIDLPEGRFVGVMADDVARLRPDALGEVVSGYRSVDYGVLAR